VQGLSAEASGYPGGAAVADEVGAGLPAVSGVEEPHGGDLGGLLVRVLLHARVEGVPCLRRRRRARASRQQRKAGEEGEGSGEGGREGGREGGGAGTGLRGYTL
jgi:hypothetical protein